MTGNGTNGSLQVRQRYVVDCRRVETLQDFVEAMNVGLIRPAGGEWSGNMDALNDYLSWPAEREYELELRGSAQCAVTLGHEAMALWLRAAAQRCHLSASADFRRRIEEAARCDGPTLFSFLCGIITDNRHVRLVVT